MSTSVDRGKVENPDKISSEQGREPELLAMGPGFAAGHIDARQALSPLRRHHLLHDHSQNTGLVIQDWVADIYR